MPLPQSIERQLDCCPEAVGAGRHLVARALGGWGVPATGDGADLHWDVLLVVTELLTGALMAGAHTAILRVDRSDGHVRIGAADDSPSGNLPGEPPDVDGVEFAHAIVGALSDGWGETFYDAELREVWSLVAIPPGVVVERDRQATVVTDDSASD